MKKIHGVIAETYLFVVGLFNVFTLCEFSSANVIHGHPEIKPAVISRFIAFELS